MAVEKMTLELATDILVNQGFHCPQCVLWHTAEALGMDKKLALKMSGGLGGGCFAGGTCGAVAGAVISLGLVYGYNEAGAAEQNAILISKVQEFEKRFTEKYGTLLCKELLSGWDFSRPGHMEKIMSGGLTRNCPQICADVCEILDDMLPEYLK